MGVGISLALHAGTILTSMQGTHVMLNHPMIKHYATELVMQTHVLGCKKSLQRRLFSHQSNSLQSRWSVA